MQRAGIVYREEEPAEYANIKFHTCKFVFVFLLLLLLVAWGLQPAFGAEWGEEEGEGGEVSSAIERGGVVRISSLKVNYALIVMGKSGFHLYVSAAFGMEMKKNGSLFIFLKKHYGIMKLQAGGGKGGGGDGI